VSKINVRRGRGQVVVTLSDDANSRIEVTLNEAEASMLAALLLETPDDALALQDRPETPMVMDSLTLRANARPFLARRLDSI
jgi:hypothetical protein